MGSSHPPSDQCNTKLHREASISVAVRQPVEELARHAWERLMQRLRGDVVAHAKVQLACSIEWRDSTKL